MSDDLRTQRKANGLCTQCGAPLDRKGRQCKRCNQMNNDSKWFFHQRQHARGKCTQCLNPLDREGWFCSSCIKTMRYKARERNMERRSNGLCVQCGTPTGGGYCRRCLDMRMDRYQKKKNQPPN